MVRKKVTNMNEMQIREALAKIDEICLMNKRIKGNECKEICDKCVWNTVKEALKMQISMEPIYIYAPNLKALDEPVKTNMWRCPRCNLTYNTKDRHCICGQSIKHK